MQLMVYADEVQQSAADLETEGISSRKSVEEVHIKRMRNGG